MSFTGTDLTIGHPDAWTDGTRVPFTAADLALLSFRCEQRRRFDEQQQILARFAAEAERRAEEAAA